MADHDTERLLSGFADHLLKNRLADEKHGRFMVNWVRRFLTLPPPVANATADECLQTYLRTLEREQCQEWQVEQARQSVTAWFAWRGSQPKTEYASKLTLGEDIEIAIGIEHLASQPREEPRWLAERRTMPIPIPIAIWGVRKHAAKVG